MHLLNTFLEQGLEALNVKLVMAQKSKVPNFISKTIMSLKTSLKKPTDANNAFGVNNLMRRGGR